MLNDAIPPRRVRLLWKIRRALASRRVPWFAVAVGVLLCLPAIGSGFQPEDREHQAAIAIGAAPFGTPGNPAWGNYLAKDAGLLPWIASLDWQLTFSRPLSVVTHWVDYKLWPESSALMHAQSLLWYALLIYLGALLFRRTLPSAAVAGLATLLYAVEDAHGISVGWLAGRNTLLAATFGVGAILLHDIWRREGSKLAGWLSPFVLWMALAAGESGVGAFAYLGAHALFLDSNRQRWRALLPAALVFIVWALAYHDLGFGSRGSGVYVSPLEDPSSFGALVLNRMPVLLLGAVGVLPSTVGVLVLDGSPAVFFALVAAALFGATVCLAPLCRRHREAKFWLVGAGLSAVPLCATLPGDRLLYFPGLGVVALLALVVRAVVTRDSLVGWTRPIAWTATCGALLLNVVVGPLIMPLRSRGLRDQTDALAALAKSALREHQPGQHLIIVNAPSLLTSGAMLSVHAGTGHPIPKHNRLLHGGPGAVQLTRLDDRTLLVRPERGFMRTPFNNLYRREGLSIGTGFQLTRFQAVVTDVDDDDMPTEVRFRFGWPLESTHLSWIAWSGHEFAPFTPPAVGESVIIHPYRDSVPLPRPVDEPAHQAGLVLGAEE